MYRNISYDQPLALAEQKMAILQREALRQNYIRHPSVTQSWMMLEEPGTGIGGGEHTQRCLMVRPETVVAAASHSARLGELQHDGDLV